MFLNEFISITSQYNFVAKILFSSSSFLCVCRLNPKIKMWSHRITFVLLNVCLIATLCEGLPINANRPSYREYAKMARFIVHKSNWTSMGTISTVPVIRGFPMVNVISVADSALDAPSTGSIYFLLTDLDFTGNDLKVNNKLTLMFSEDQDLACTSNNTDTMEPTCARIILLGKLERLTPNTDEFKQADEWYTSRHPASVHWRKTHAFYFCKLNIEQVVVLDYYGGPHFVSPDDYYNANYDADNINSIDNYRQPSVIGPRQY